MWEWWTVCNYTSQKLSYYRAHLRRHVYNLTLLNFHSFTHIPNDANNTAQLHVKAQKAEQKHSPLEISEQPAQQQLALG